MAEQGDGGLGETDPHPTRERILNAAIDAFSSSRFDDVSLRDIERQSGVKRGLVAYHFGSKEALWRAAIVAMTDRLHTERMHYGKLLDAVSPHERRRLLCIMFVQFCAANPQYLRMLVKEEDVERTQFFVDHQFKPGIQFFNRVTDRGADDEFGEEEAIWQFVFTGAAGTIFAAPTLAKAVFGVDVSDERFIAKFAEFMARLAELLPEMVREAFHDEAGYDHASPPHP